LADLKLAGMAGNGENWRLGLFTLKLHAEPAGDFDAIHLGGRAIEYDQVDGIDLVMVKGLRNGARFEAFGHAKARGHGRQHIHGVGPIG